MRKKSSGSQSTGAPPSGASLLRPHFIDPDARDVRIALRLNAALEALGDRWSLLVVRDMLFEGARSYREFASSAEGIATNILAARLRHLEKEGIIGKSPDPTDDRGPGGVYRVHPLRGAEEALGVWPTPVESAGPGLRVAPRAGDPPEETSLHSEPADRYCCSEVS